MPCEACSVQFTVFRRKRCCLDCKRFYCSNCLSPSSRESAAVGPRCERCSIFAKRPLLKIDLLQLKPKDLIFYLQSKHISTAGCVEKDELICLVLAHIQETDPAVHLPSSGSSNSSSSKGSDNTHSFDALKQSCQNFFSTLSEKVESFSFDSKQNKHDSENSRCTSSTSSPSSLTSKHSHISEQPRSSIREIPTYASSQNKELNDSIIQINYNFPKSAPVSNINDGEPTLNPDMANIDDQHCSHSSTQSLELNSSMPRNLLPLFTRSEMAKRVRSNDKISNDSVSGCDCSDDELIASFRARTGNGLESPQSASSLDNPLTGPPDSSTMATSTSTVTKKSSPSLKIENYGESSESSFEELGAIGGISDDSKTGADNSARSSELWQFVDKEALMSDLGAELEDEGQIHSHQHSQLPQQSELVRNESEPTTQMAIQSDEQPQMPPISKVTRLKKVTRRHSDGYLNRRKHDCDDELPISGKEGPLATYNLIRDCNLFQLDETSNERDEIEGSMKEDSAQSRKRFHCNRCGKNRVNIKKHVERMRRHLEDSQMTEGDIKRELEDFLAYLEKRTKSIDCSDSENTISATPSASGVRVNDSESSEPIDDGSYLYNENEGIYVYAAPEAYHMSMTDSRFINLEDIESLEELGNLCVKQLKEVLMLNRIDYKGCCEKQELLDRVVRLWKNLKSAPSIDKLQTDELCKICMDAPIECVILECGHMATCTNCGKVLNECPICRQYIVRVVRIFKA